MFNYKLISIVCLIVSLVLAGMLVFPKATNYYTKQGYVLCLDQVRVEMFTSLRDRGFVPITISNQTLILVPQDGQK